MEIMAEQILDHNRKAGYDSVQMTGYGFVVTMSHA
jgi:hypothetical protein